jgi:hypothetical protein
MPPVREVRLKPLMNNGSQCWQASIDARDGTNYAVAGQTVELALANLCYRLAGEVVR